MPRVFVEKGEAFRHPMVETAARMARDLSRDVRAILEPHELRTRRRGIDRDLAIFAKVSRSSGLHLQVQLRLDEEIEREVPVETARREVLR